MQREGTASWRASLDDNSLLLHVALYVRDACRLGGPADPLNPPPLEPAPATPAAPAAPLPPSTRAAAGREWLWWWRELVSLQGAALRDGVEPGIRHRQREAAEAAHLLDWPELQSLAPRPLLQGAVRVAFEDAVRWRGEREPELMAARRARQRTPGPFRELADRLVRRFGVPPDRLRIGIFVVPVRGGWSHLAAPGVLLCSPAVAADSAHFLRLVEAAFVSGL